MCPSSLIINTWIRCLVNNAYATKLVSRAWLGLTWFSFVSSRIVDAIAEWYQHVTYNETKLVTLSLDSTVHYHTRFNTVHRHVHRLEYYVYHIYTLTIPYERVHAPALCTHSCLAISSPTVTVRGLCTLHSQFRDYLAWHHCVHCTMYPVRFSLAATWLPRLWRILA